MVKNGTTSAGWTRWRCKACGLSTVRQRPDITRRSQAQSFLAWVLSFEPQQGSGGTGRSFRASINWCWNIEVPQPGATGEVHQVVMLDGTYFQDWCLLIAYTGTHVIAWQWCDEEKKAAWQALLQRLPAPDMVVIDGGTGLNAALAECWPHTPIQRCYFHIMHTTTRHLTRRPKLEAGQELRALVGALMKVTCLDEAAAWMSAYSSWEARWDEFLKHRTYADTDHERPTGTNARTQWWYTHRELRKCRSLLRGLIRRDELFTWLTIDNAPAPRTTSPLEGGPNKAVKDLLRAHRAMPDHHARRAVERLLNSRAEHPHKTNDLINTSPSTPPLTRPTRDEPVNPQHGTDFTYEDGNHLRKGWAGRPN